MQFTKSRRERYVELILTFNIDFPHDQNLALHTEKNSGNNTFKKVNVMGDILGVKNQ